MHAMRKDTALVEVDSYVLEFTKGIMITVKETL
jgi:hypothetical protein